MKLKLIFTYLNFCYVIKYLSHLLVPKRSNYYCYYMKVHLFIISFSLEILIFLYRVSLYFVDLIIVVRCYGFS